MKKKDKYSLVLIVGGKIEEVCYTGNDLQFMEENASEKNYEIQCENASYFLDSCVSWYYTVIENY